MAIGAPYVVPGRERQSTRGKEPGVVAAAPERLVDVRVASAAPEVAELVRRFVAAQPSVIASR